jgi:hypothetical protein
VSSCGLRRTLVARAGSRQPHVIFAMTKAMRFYGIAVSSHAGAASSNGSQPICPVNSPSFPKSDFKIRGLYVR